MKKTSAQKKAKTEVFISKITHHDGFSLFWYEVSVKRHLFKGSAKECADKKSELINKYKNCSLTVRP